MRLVRRAVKLILPLSGVFVAFFGVLYLESDLSRLLAVLAGVLLVEAGVWNLANPLLPSTRRYLELRAEVDGFLDQVRRLNAQAVLTRTSDTPAAWEGYRRTLAEMHESVDRMGPVAGKEEGMEDLRPPSGEAG